MISDGHGPVTVVEFFKRTNSQSAMNSGMKIRKGDGLLHYLLRKIVGDTNDLTGGFPRLPVKNPSR